MKELRDFSLTEYRDLLRAFVDANYSFRFFTETLADQEAIIFLRHDIEIDINAALALASTEHELGIRSTYFLCPTTPFFNMLSAEVEKAARTLVGMGHAVGFHLELPDDSTALAASFWNDNTRAALCPVANPNLVSLHSPHSIDGSLLLRFPALLAVYSDTVSGRLAYISDSMGRWRFGSPLDSVAFSNRRAIQVLTHPVWWVYEGGTPAAKLNAALYRASRLEGNIRRFLPKLASLIYEDEHLVGNGRGH